MVKESTVWRSKVCQMGKTATRYDDTHMSAAASAAMWCMCVCVSMWVQQAAL